MSQTQCLASQPLSINHTLSLTHTFALQALCNAGYVQPSKDPEYSMSTKATPLAPPPYPSAAVAGASGTARTTATTVRAAPLVSRLQSPSSPPSVPHEPHKRTSTSVQSSRIISADLKVQLPTTVAHAFSCAFGDKVRLRIVYGGRLQVGCEEATIQQAPHAGFLVVVNPKQREMVQGKYHCGWTEHEDGTLLLLLCDASLSKVSMCSARGGGGEGTGMCSELEDHTKPLLHQAWSFYISIQHVVVEQLKSKGLDGMTEPQLKTLADLTSAVLVVDLPL